MTEMERLVQQAITKTTGLDPEQVHLDATLDSLGVDSLTAAEVLVEIEIQLGRQFPISVLRRLDDAVTVRAIAAFLSSELAVHGEPA